jgi:hypothetical protein
MILPRIEPSDHPDQRLVVGHAPRAAQRSPRLFTWFEAVQVVAIWNDHEAIGIIASVDMNTDGFAGAADDASWNDARKQSAIPRDKDGGILRIATVKAPMVHSPADGAHARETRDKPTNKVSVIHPCLHYVWRMCSKKEV